MLLLAILVFSLVLTGCQSAPIDDQVEMPIGKPYDSSRAPQVESHDDRVIFTLEETHFSLPQPQGWEVYGTEYGVVIAEKIGSVAARGQLDGLLAYVFLTPLENYSITTATPQAALLFEQVVQDPDYVGSAVVSPVYDFSWDEYSAAYYLLHDPQLNVYTLVIGVVLPDSDQLLTGTISAPPGQEGRIRELLPQLLGDMQLNNEAFSRAALESLPARFEFPLAPQQPSSQTQ